MLMLKSLRRFSQCNLREIYVKTAALKYYSTVNNELAARPKPKTPEDDDDAPELNIAAALFDNSSITHRPGKPAPKPTPPKPKGNDYLSLKADYAKSAQKQQSGKTTKEQPQVHGRVLYDRNMDMEIIRLERQQDPLLTGLLTKVRSRKRRDKDSEILVEGHRLIREALECGLQMNALIFSQTHQLKHIYQLVGDAQRKSNTKVYKVGQHDIKTWSTLVTPPGLMAIFQRPPDNGLLPSPAAAADKPLPVSVICDNIREPNNLGSIIRTCAALPCHQVIVTRGCCDPWESKALRGGCGGQFRVRVLDDCDWADLGTLMPALVGDSGKLSVLVAESNVSKAPAQTRTVEYTDIAMQGDHCVVVIGGESHGVSQEAYDFLATAGSNLGSCVHIPLANGVESLNVTSALTLILYELRRNLRKPI